MGAMSAFEYYFPSSQIIGCYFRWFKWCVALAFIPRRHIQGVFADKILDEAPLDTYPSLEDFTDCMLRT